MKRHFGIAQDVNGNVIPSATIRVRLAGTGTDATIYSDDAYTPLANPFTSETDGVYQFHARNGRYDIIVTKTPFTFDDDDTADILLEDTMSTITPAQITGDEDDYEPTNGLNASIWRLATDASRTITGIAAGNVGQPLTILNVGSFGITFSNDSGSSVAANRVITGNGSDLTIASDGSVRLVYDSTVSRWRVVSSVAGSAVSTTTVSMPPGGIVGLRLSNNATDATNDIDIAVGAASSDDTLLDDRATIYLATALTKRLDANWSVGDAQGGLDTGAIADTTYHVFAIKRTDTNVVDILFSASVSAPTMPASYDKKRRIGSFIRSSGAILAFDQRGDEFLHAQATEDFDSVLGTSASSITLTVPTGIRVWAHVRVMHQAADAGIVVYSSLDTTDVAPGAAYNTTPGFDTTGANSASKTLNIRTNTAGQIRGRATAANTDVAVYTLGWIDRRGRDD